MSEMRDHTPVRTVILRLNTLYTWMTEAFSVLDPDGAGYVCMSTRGRLIREALTRAGLEKLWDSLLSARGEDGRVTEEGFMGVYLKWMGLNDAWAIVEGLQRSRSVEVDGRLHLLHGTCLIHHD